MKKTVTITIDIENDCPPYLRTYRGVEVGLPRLLDVLYRHNIEATFFVTGDAASKYPMVIKELAKNYEIGCHGYSHKRFDRMGYREAAHEIEKSTEVLSRIVGKQKLLSFRAPNLIFPERFMSLLWDNGYSIDSSLARYKIRHLGEVYATKRDSNNRLLRIPVSATSSILRLPFGIEILKRLSSPVVLFFHPWEFVEMQNEPVRWDCRINTGSMALRNLDSLIESFKNNHCHFCMMSDFA